MKKITKTLLLSISALLCSVTAVAQGFIHADGKKVVDINGKELILRGHAPGGWMIQEPYMMETQDYTSSQHEIKAKIQALLGEEYTKEFYKKWLENGFRREDVKLLAEMGFNSIRLPMHYNLFTLPIEEEPVKGENTWIEDGFNKVDNVLEWCKEFKIYLILDMHGTPGGQGYDSAISDYDGSKPSLWESEDNRNKLVALWKKLAERYKDEQYIGGYDLINEPNWAFDGNNKNGCNESTNNTLWNLYKRLITEIRTIDKNHMIIIEGNCWCNSYTGLPNINSWDNNLCLQFHKYWTYNDKGSIQFIINLRDSKNVPVWCGESGENSTKWYTDAVKLLEENNIGWSWWTWKKLNSQNGMCNVKSPARYDAIKNYWKNGGTKPSQEAARRAFDALADAYLLENCTVNRAVADALLRQPHTDELKPYADNKVPGKVYAPDYDLGRYGIAYLDLDGAEDFHGSAGDFVAWNQGWNYRADGVDIGKCSDPETNGYYVGWTSAGEWTKYTIDVAETAAYKLGIRYASNNSKTVMAFEVDGVAITSDVTLNSTGNWDSWRTVSVPNIILTEGKHVLKVTTVSGGANLGSFSFTDPSAITNIDFKALSATTSDDGKHIFLSVNKPLTDGNMKVADFSVKSDSEPVEIETVAKSATSDQSIDITLNTKVYGDNNVTLSYTGTTVTDTDGNPLPAFSNMKVNNTAIKRAQIPGQINVEDYYQQSGLSFEKCDDTTGGATNFGYTDPGDYIDYIVNIKYADTYTFQFRVAAQNSGGKFEVQLFDDDNNKTLVGTYSVGASGGWQTWKTQTAKAKLPKGTYRLRIYIVNKEFNMNWFSFTNPAGIDGVELAGTATVSLYNLAGVNVYKAPHTLGTDLNLDTNALTPGVYILKIEGKGISQSQKIVVK